MAAFSFKFYIAPQPPITYPLRYGIYRIEKIVTPEVPESEQKALKVELDRLAGGQEFRAYVAALRAKGKVTINKEVLEKKAQ